MPESPETGYRIFFWHEVGAGVGDVHFGVTIENGQQTGEIVVTGIAGTELPNASNYADAGMCIAKADLFGGYDTLQPSEIQIPAGQVGVIRDWDNIQAKRIVGAMLAFTVGGCQGEGPSRLRTVFAPAGEPLTGPDQLDESPIAKEEGPPRGTWPWESISLTMKEEDKFMLNGQDDRVRVEIAAGPGHRDFQWTAANSVDDDAADMKGNYGVRYRDVVLKWENNQTGPEPPPAHTLELVLYNPQALGSGEYFVGAVEHGEPAQKHGTGKMDPKQGVVLQTVEVPAGPAYGEVKFAMEVGGAATTAVYAYLAKKTD